MTNKIEISKSVNQLMDYAFQGKEIERGHNTTGHKCVNKNDKKIAKEENASILYGEILPEGLEKALDDDHLSVKNAVTVCDLGSGLGKNILRIWLKYKHIMRATGVELSKQRYLLGEKAILRLLEKYKEFTRIEYKSGRLIKIADSKGRIFSLKCENLFTCSQIYMADIIICNTDFPKKLINPLTKFLEKSKKKCKIMSYLKLASSGKLQQMKINKSKNDVFLASWNKVSKGHHFYLWEHVKKCKN